MSYRHDPRPAQYGTLELFDGCSRRALQTLSQLGTRIELPPGKVLARQGSHRQEFVLVVRGAADVVRDGSVVDHLGPGDHHGEFTLLRGVPHPTTLVAMEPMVVDVFAAREFRAAYRALPSFRAAIDRELDRRAAAWLTLPATRALSSAARGPA